MNKVFVISGGHRHEIEANYIWAVADGTLFLGEHHDVPVAGYAKGAWDSFGIVPIEKEENSNASE